MEGEYTHFREFRNFAASSGDSSETACGWEDGPGDLGDRVWLRQYRWPVDRRLIRRPMPGGSTCPRPWHYLLRYRPELWRAGVQTGPIGGEPGPGVPGAQGQADHRDEDRA